MPYTIHRESAALPASGAYDEDSSLWELGPNTEEITVALTYTLGGAGGYPGGRVLWTVAGVTGMIGTIANPTLSVSGTEGRESQYVRVFYLPALTGATEGKALLVLKVPPGATHVKIEPQEVGNTGAPGTLEVRLARRV